MADTMTLDPSASTADASTSVITSSGSNPPNLDGILLLEAPLAKVPFDELRRQQKTQQRLIEREIQFATSTLNDLSKSTSTTSSSSAADVEKNLDALLGRLNGLKRKLGPLADSAKASLRMAQSRTDHLQTLHEIRSVDSVQFQEWSRMRLDRMVVDYMLRRGYRGAAKELASTRGVGDLVDVGLFEEIANVEDSLCPRGFGTGADEGVKPSCTLALAWCSENKATLRKIRTPLEFNLRLQEFIELTRTRTPDSIKEAIAYARRHLLPLVTTVPSTSLTKDKEKKEDKDAEYDRLAAEAIRREVSRAMGLLACGPNSWAYVDLYNLARWRMLGDSFRACALQIHSLPAQPILHIALSAGLSCLKLRQCYAASGGGGGGGQERNVDCPVCDAEGLGTLAAEVPWSHHENSTLVDSVSGNVMDENDPPLALANGRVYAQSTMVALMDKGMVKDPRTGEQCRLDQVRKVFIS